MLVLLEDDAGIVAVLEGQSELGSTLIGVGVRSGDVKWARIAEGGERLSVGPVGNIRWSDSFPGPMSVTLGEDIIASIPLPIVRWKFIAIERNGDSHCVSGESAFRDIADQLPECGSLIASAVFVRDEYHDRWALKTCHGCAEMFSGMPSIPIQLSNQEQQK